MAALRVWAWPQIQSRYGSDAQAQSALAEVLAVEGLTPELRGVQLLWPVLGWPELRMDRLSVSSPDPASVAEGRGLRLRLGPASLWALSQGRPAFHSLDLAEVRLSIDRPDPTALRVGGVLIRESPGDSPMALSALDALGPVRIGRLEVLYAGQALVARGLGLEAGSQRPRVLVGDADLGEVFALADYLGAIPRTGEGPRDGPQLAWSGRVSELDLEARLPAPADYARPSAWLDTILGAEGALTLRDFQLVTAGSLSALTGVSMDLRVADGRIRSTIAGRDVSIISEAWVHSGALALGAVRADLSMRADSRSVEGLSIDIRGLEVDDPKLRLRTEGSVWVPLPAEGSDSAPPSELRLEGSVDGAQPKSLAGVLPTVIGAQAREWMSMALQDGRPIQGSFSVQGDPDRFPFPNGDGGRFAARLRVENQTLQFADPARWPAVTGLFADIRFDNGSLSFESRQAQFMANPVRLAKGQIPELGALVPTLDLTLDLGSSLPDLLAAVQASPVRELINGITDEAVARGRADVVVGLSLNLNDIEASKVEGRLRVRESQVQLLPVLPLVDRLRGELSFTEQGLDSLSFEGAALGGPVSLRQQPADQALVLEAEGRLQGVALERWLGPQLGLQMQGVATGETPWQMRLEAAGGGLRLRLMSDLRGLAIQLPAPAAKAAGDRWGLEILLDRPGLPATAQLPARGGPRQSWQIRTQAGQLGGRFTQEREVDGRAAREPRLQGLISVGSPLPLSAIAPLASRGLVIAAQATGPVSVDAWIEALARKLKADPKAPETNLPPALGGIVLRAPAATFGRQRLEQVAFGATPPQPNGPPGWRMTVSSIQAAGDLLWGPSPSNAAASRLQGQLSRLWLQRPGDGAEASAAPASAASVQPGDWPEINLQVTDLRLGRQALGRLDLRARPSTTSKAWDIDSAVLAMPGGVLNATGSWIPTLPAPATSPLATQLAAPSAPSGTASSSVRGPSGLVGETRMKAQLNVADGDALLTHLVGPNLVRGAAGEIQADLRWPGSPADFSLRSGQGSLTADLGKGQFLKAEPGAAKLLGVLSLQSLSRRITFDFRDLFSAGFSFETVRGTAAVAQGTVSTNNLRIVGIQAAVLIDGSADLAKETQALDVLILPEVNAGLASLGYALINPAIGLASFLAQFLVQDPLSKALSYRVRITGPWADPVVEEVQTPSAAPKAGPSAAPGRAP